MRIRWFFALFVFLQTAVALPAADWPQWRGPNRNGVSKEKGLLAAWPKNGPDLSWAYGNTGLGYSSPSIVGSRLYILGARKDKTHLICLDISKQPKELWAAEIGPMFTFKDNQWGDGPRSSPTVDGDHIYVLTGFGKLACISTKGKIIWSKNLEKDFGGKVMTEWGYSESVLIDGDKLICMPGGKKGTLLALDKKSGNPLWQSKEVTDMASYASMVTANIGGVRQYVALTYASRPTGAAVVGVRAKDGKLLWRYHPSNFARSVISAAPTPIVTGDQVYVTVGENSGCLLLKIMHANGKFQVKNQYSRGSRRNMANDHGGVVLVKGHIFGFSKGRGLVCQNLTTGRETWNERFRLEGVSVAVIAADGHLYLYNDEGTAVLLKTSTKGWLEKGRFNIPKKSNTPKTLSKNRLGKIWTHPVIANGRLYLRDQEHLMCFDIRAKK